MYSIFAWIGYESLHCRSSYAQQCLIISASFRTHLFIASSFFNPLSSLPLPLFFVRALWFAICMLAPRSGPTRAGGQAKGAHEACGTIPSGTCSAVLFAVTPSPPSTPTLPFACGRYITSLILYPFSVSLMHLSCDTLPIPHSILTIIITPDGRKTSACCDLDMKYLYSVGTSH